MSAPQNHYQILGLTSAATAEEIKKAYRRKAMEYHPDRNPDNTAAEEMFKAVNLAHSVLSDPAQKSRYDLLHSWKGAASYAPPAPAKPAATAPADKVGIVVSTAEMDSFIKKFMDQNLSLTNRGIFNKMASHRVYFGGKTPDIDALRAVVAEAKATGTLDPAAAGVWRIKETGAVYVAEAVYDMLWDKEVADIDPKTLRAGRIMSAMTGGLPYVEEVEALYTRAIKSCRNRADEVLKTRV